MKYTLLIAALAVVSTVTYLSYKTTGEDPIDMAEDEIRALWTQWREDFDKDYLFGEDLHRYEIFKANNKIIQDHNNHEPKHTFTLAHNQFSDLTKEEYKALYLTLQVDEDKELNIEELDEVNVPASWDWREHGAVNAVKNQGSCGSCWAFSAVAALEGAYFLKHDDLLSFSEQQLLDCDKVDSACNGGLMDYAFKYAETHKMVKESSLPYKGRKGSCSKKVKNLIKKGYAEVTSFVDVKRNSEASLVAASANTVVSIAVEADQSSFQFYSSGVMTKKCGKNLDHGVALVGYGTENGVGYWLVRNSWGESWGDNGYIKLARGGKYANLNGGAGQCGILGSASYPKVE